MKKLLLLLVSALMMQASMAAPVDRETAGKVARTFLTQRQLLDSNEPLTWASTYSDTSGNACFYVFQIGQRGFVLAGADDRCKPILGYSLEGTWDTERLPANLVYLIEGYRSDISRGIQENIAPIPQHLKEWTVLLSGEPVDTTGVSAKSVPELLSTQWSQGYGYNHYTPTYNGGHVVVGCVALAIAQIIHYFGYPTHGYGDHQYVAEYHGLQSADFYNSTYDHSLMPDQVSYYSSEDEIEATSLLCYHCGVAVNMRYENPNHPSGSGAYSHSVPGAMKHFGYFHVEQFFPSESGEQGWHNVLRPELDAGRPLYAAGTGTDGSHAYVCDGYNDNGQYHFNYGWGGYCNGYYTLQAMLYGLSLEMYGNFIPSYIESHSSPIHIASEGAPTAGGSSWTDANSNLQEALLAAEWTGAPIWMKEGTYYGDTTDAFAFSVPRGTHLYGGFAGTEDSLEQRTLGLHPTLLDGQGVQAVMTCTNNSSSTDEGLGGSNTLVSGLTITHGLSDFIAGLDLSSNCTAEWITLRDNVATQGGCIAGVYSGTLQLSTIYGNNSDSAIVTLYSSNGKLKNSLISGNSTPIVVDINSNALVIENTIANNSGVAVRSATGSSILSGNIVWANDQSLLFDADSPRVIYCHIESDTTADPLFTAPTDSTHRGLGALLGDYRLQEYSPCIDQGEKTKGNQTRVDLDGNYRFVHNRADQGCYESDYPVGIYTVENAATIRCYPNPAHHFLTVENDAHFSGNIALYDATGRLVLQKDAGSDSVPITLDLRGLTPGLYLLRAGEQMEKVVIR